MLLTAVVKKTPNGDEIVGIDRPIPSKPDTPIPFLVEATVSPGYADISSIENWHQLGLERKLLGKDYLYCRDRINDIICQKAIDSCKATISDPSIVTPEIGDRYFVGQNPVDVFEPYPDFVAQWDGEQYQFTYMQFAGYERCSPEEQRIAMELNLGDPKVHNAQFGTEEAQYWRDNDHEESIPVCEFRIKRAESLIQNYLSNYKQQIMLMITSAIIELDVGAGKQQFCVDFHKNYWRFQFFGSEEDYHPVLEKNQGIGIIDYIYGRSIFQGRGLIDMDWEPDGITMQQLCDRIYDILVVGNYRAIL